MRRRKKLAYGLGLVAALAMVGNCSLFRQEQTEALIRKPGS